jgi:ubiquinone/menaquinone biosynthesis C-methylase UbiE
LSKARRNRRLAWQPRGVRRRAQRAVFTTLYRFGGRVYDPLTVLVFGGAWARWRESIVPYLAEGRVLDLGCGTGEFAESLSRQGYNVVGLDREPSMLRRAGTRASLHSRLIRGDATRLPFRSASFASCIATFPANYILQRTTLDEIARVVRPGGVLAIVMSGYTERWSLWRQPIRIALRFFYGARSADNLPANRFIVHPLLTGGWKWLENGEDHVLLWTGNRAVDG